MPAWAKAEASAHLDTLMFFDPVAYLPYELVSIIFGHLSPGDLLNASSVSRGWREHTRDEELWRNIFAREGWHMDITKIRDFERRSRDKGKRAVTGASVRGGTGLQRKDSLHDSSSHLLPFSCQVMSSFSSPTHAREQSRQHRLDPSQELHM